MAKYRGTTEARSRQKQSSRRNRSQYCKQSQSEIKATTKNKTGFINDYIERVRSHDNRGPIMLPKRSVVIFILNTGDVKSKQRVLSNVMHLVKILGEFQTP